jgi:hypothetical protein
MCPAYWICSIPFLCNRGIFPRWASCMVQQSNPVNGASFTRAIHIHQLPDLLSTLIRVLKSEGNAMQLQLLLDRVLHNNM